MAKKRRMPVNVLQEAPEQSPGDDILRDIVGGPEKKPEEREPVQATESATKAREWQEARRLQHAQRSAKGRALWSAAVGLVPVAPLALAVFFGIQLSMIRALARQYDASFRNDWIRSLLVSLLVGVAMLGIANAAGLILGLLPIIGRANVVIGLAASSVFASYVLGKVYVLHFEAGGTLLDLDPKRMKDHFRETYGTDSADGAQRGQLKDPFPPSA
jgi:uncharacterized protein (DUF697 family)